MRIAGIIGVLIIIFLAILLLSSSEEIFGSNDKKNNLGLRVEDQGLVALLQRDTDGDGIADWEEDLWGTDRNKKITFEDTPDATYIANRKKELNLEATTDVKNLTETEKFAREFFASYSAMKASGEVDQETINAFSGSLGQEIADPTLLDIYTLEKTKLSSSDNTATQKKYYETLVQTYQKYLDIGLGNELGLIGSIVSGNTSVDTTSEAKTLGTIGNAYIDFGKDVMKISAPESLTSYHLKIANSANNTGISILNMNKVIDDPIIGLSGLSQYQKYSDELISAVEELETTLSDAN